MNYRPMVVVSNQLVSEYGGAGARCTASAQGDVELALGRQSWEGPTFLWAE